MFEYLMPGAFPAGVRGQSFIESVRFCLYAQKRRVLGGQAVGHIGKRVLLAGQRAELPLGARLRGAGPEARAVTRDMVVSPYSSFLALAVDPEGGVRNLRRLEDFGALGRWGFIEALDFTQGAAAATGANRCAATWRTTSA